MCQSAMYAHARCSFTIAISMTQSSFWDAEGKLEDVGRLGTEQDFSKVANE